MTSRVVRLAYPLIVFYLFAFSSCKEKTIATESTPIVTSVAEVSVDKDSSYGESARIEFNTVSLNDGSFEEFDVSTETFHTDAFAARLADPMKFAELPDQNLPEGPTAVVGSTVCVYYPGASIDSVAGLAALPKGIPIPFGTIIPLIGEKIVNKDEQTRYGMFQFQDNWNWFYRTKYQGKEGLVFGADLYGLNDSNKENRISARLYQMGGQYDSFYPILGYRDLPKKVLDALERDRLAIQDVGSGEYGLRGYRTDLMPDDMIALYDLHRQRWDRNQNGWNRNTPLFVTTDLAAHAQHLIFDRTLQFLEEAVFLPRLSALVDGFLAELKARESGADSYRETFDKAYMYFQVAKALLELAPERVKNDSDEYGADPYLYREKNLDEVLSPYPEAVRLEIAKIMQATMYGDSHVFTFSDGTKSTEDYTQYKPRGHYTKNSALESYFRAMMWFGRIHFLIAAPGPEPLSDGGRSSSDSTALTLAMEPIALLVTDTVRFNPKLYAEWEALFNPITALIGNSDDLSFADILPLWKDERVSEKEFGEWTANKDNLIAFMEKAHLKLRPPAISGASVFFGPSEGTGELTAGSDGVSVDRKPPMGWRLFGQRFTYDSAVHEVVSPPRLLSRDMVRGLDIMKAFGSKTADALLEASDYPLMDGLEARLDSLEEEFSSYDYRFWDCTYYNDVLFQVRSQARFEKGAGFYFTEGDGWGTKAMLASHGTWSELRHDTLLYVKQVYAERAGDGDFEPTFRTKPIPEPIHYIEPNVPFWQGSTIAVQKLLRTLDRYQLLDEETAQVLGRLQEIYARAAAIAEQEAKDSPVPEADVKWIATIPGELLNLVLVHVEGGDVTDEDQLKMAIIADVYTNAELRLVLETAVGIPYRLYVPLNDTQGGKRVAVGYGFSYYEFHHPMDDRMTDEAWKEIVYAPSAKLDEYQPFWMKDKTVSRELAK